MSAGEELKLLDNFQDSNQWLNSNYERLQKDYPNEFVAIDNKRVVGFGKILEDLVKKLRSKGIDAALVLIEFIPERGLKIIL